GVGDACDNCKNTANYNQDDIDHNGVGDSCELLPAGTNICNTSDVESQRLEPNLDILLDHSGSIQGYDYDYWGAAKNALKTVAGELTSKFNIGFGLFPIGSMSCPATYATALDHINNPKPMSESQFQTMVNATSTNPNGSWTPTHTALKRI